MILHEKGCRIGLIAVIFFPAALITVIPGREGHASSPAIPSAGSLSHGAAKKPSASMVRVRLITRDSSGELLPCRVTVADSLGKYWKADGLSSSDRMFFYSMGDTILSLPENTPFRITLYRGPEYTPVCNAPFRSPSASSPEPFEVEFALTRWVDPKTLDWYSCDTEVHGSGNISPKNLFIIQQAEDLNVLQLTAHGEGNWRSGDYAYWRQGPFPFSKSFHRLIIGEEWRSRTWQNHMVVMGASSPLSSFGNGFYESPDCTNAYSYPPALDFCDEAHQLGGIVFPCHPFPLGEPFTGDWEDPFERHTAYELPIDTALGKVDGMDVYQYGQSDGWNRFVWYKLLNCGFRVPPFAGTDAMDLSGNYSSVTPGAVRVYVQVPGQTDSLDVREWMRWAAEGRSFVSSGAVVFFTVNGELPGSELKPETSNGAATVTVRTEARWMGGIGTVNIVVNGEDVISRRGNGAGQVVIEQSLRLTRSSWIAARVETSGEQVYSGCAHSGPVYVTLDNRPIRSPQDARYFVDWIDRFIARLDSSNHFDTAAHRERTFELYRNAQDIFRARSDTTVVTSAAADAPGGFALYQAFPNPFNSETEIAYDLLVKGRISVEVYDVLGRKVRTVREGMFAPGTHRIRLNMDDAASGVYFVRLSGPEGKLVRKAVLVR
jgi:hypothetical protein